MHALRLSWQYAMTNRHRATVLVDANVLSLRATNVGVDWIEIARGIS